MIQRIGFSLLVFLAGAVAQAKPIKVVATTTTLSYLVKKVGGDQVNVIPIAKGTQDPHYLEAKPSYMVKLRGAELVVAVGLGLEQAWLPNVLRGSRNPKVQMGRLGFLALGPHVGPIEVPTGKLDRSQGDIHAEGNPHFYLDPIRMGVAAQFVAKKLAELRPDRGEDFLKTAQALSQEWQSKSKLWQDRIKASKVVQVVTYHRTLSYFLKHFGIDLSGEIEAKPGVPPSARHLLTLIKQSRQQGIKCFLHESFFEPTASHRVAKEVKAQVWIVPTEISALPNTDTFEALMEKLVRAVEDCGQRGQP